CAREKRLWDGFLYAMDYW
nr:immunoglobulin heavy chain junction region [Mus musculus]